MSVTVVVVKNGISDSSLNSGRDCVSLRANVLVKGMNPSLLSPAMGNRRVRLGSFALDLCNSATGVRTR